MRTELIDGAQTDARVIEMMQKAGANLSEPTELNHYLYFPQQRMAQSAADELMTRAFAVHVASPPAAASQWCVIATHTAVVSGGSVGLLRSSLERLASRFGGAYDGWEARVSAGQAR